MRAHRWTVRSALLVGGAALLLGQAPLAAAQTVGIATAQSDWPTLTLRLVLKGPVPANVFFVYWERGGDSTACQPTNWSSGPPPCESGRTYVMASPVPPGIPFEYRYSIGFCADAACQETYGQRVIWSDVVVMGSSDHSVTVTHRFGGLPETDAAPVAGPPSTPWRPAGLGLLALMAGFGLTATRRLQRHPRAR